MSNVTQLHATRRQPAMRPTRRLVNVGDLMAAKLRLFDTQADNDFARELRALLEEWDMAKEDTRQDPITAQDNAWRAQA